MLWTKMLHSLNKWISRLLPFHKIHLRIQYTFKKFCFNLFYYPMGKLFYRISKNKLFCYHPINWFSVITSSIYYYYARQFSYYFERKDLGYHFSEQYVEHHLKLLRKVILFWLNQASHNWSSTIHSLITYV